VNSDAGDIDDAGNTLLVDGQCTFLASAIANRDVLWTLLIVDT
jgi:hypothetical protein